MSSDLLDLLHTYCINSLTSMYFCILLLLSRYVNCECLRSVT